MVPAAGGVWPARSPGPSVKVGEGSASKDESVWPLLGLTGTLPGSGMWSGTPSQVLGDQLYPRGWHRPRSAVVDSLSPWEALPISLDHILQDERQVT